jgi:hypothetical protein
VPHSWNQASTNDARVNSKTGARKKDWKGFKYVILVSGYKYSFFLQKFHTYDKRCLSEVLSPTQVLFIGASYIIKLNTL